MDNPLLIIGIVVNVVLVGYALFQLSSIAFSAHESQESLAKVVLLLTVLANRQGATTQDIEAAMSKK